MGENELYPCQKLTTRDAYEVDKPVHKTVTDYAEEICAVLDDPLCVAEKVIERVKGSASEEGREMDDQGNTLALMQKALEKAQKLRQRLWELNGCV